MTHRELAGFLFILLNLICFSTSFGQDLDKTSPLQWRLSTHTQLSHAGLGMGLGWQVPYQHFRFYTGTRANFIKKSSVTKGPL